MDQLDNHDFIYTHRIINYIQASFQGRFAMLNIFAQTGHPYFKQPEVEKTQRILKELHEWEQEMFANRLNFPIAGIHAPIGIHKTALEYIRTIKPELESLAKKVKEVLASKSMLSNSQDAFLLLATFGRNAYCRDNYVRGMIRYGENAKDEYLVNNFKQYLDDAKNNIDAINELLTIYQKNDNQLNQEQVEYLAFLVRTLPGVFRAHVHDINQLLCGPIEQLSFEKAGFFKMEAEAWSQAGYSAIEAGYWRAHELSISEAQEWLNYELVDPALIAEWKSAGFPPDVAEGWIQVLFAPILAIPWANAGYSPREASILVMSGFKLPSEVPAEQVQEILEEGFNRLAEMDEAANS